MAKPNGHAPIQSTINLRVLAALSLFASKDENRPALQGVCLEVDERSITYVATDGSRLISYRYDLEPDEENQTLYGVFTIPTTHCKSFKLEKDDEGRAILSEANADRLTIAHGSTDITFMPIDCFPDWRKALPRTITSGEPAQFNFAQMKDLGRVCKLLDLGQPFVAHNGEKPAFIWFSGHPHVLGLICPIKALDEMAREAPQWARRGPERDQGDIEDFKFESDDEPHDPETGELPPKQTPPVAPADIAAAETEQPAIPTVTINLAKRCAECGQKGAAESGICLDCTTRAITQKPMKSAAGRVVQKRAGTISGRAKAARAAGNGKHFSQAAKDTIAQGDAMAKSNPSPEADAADQPRPETGMAPVGDHPATA